MATSGRGAKSGRRPPCFTSGFARGNTATHATVCGSGEVEFTTQAAVGGLADIIDRFRQSRLGRKFKIRGGAGGLFGFSFIAFGILVVPLTRTHFVFVVEKFFDLAIAGFMHFDDKTIFSRVSPNVSWGRECFADLFVVAKYCVGHSRSHFDR